MCGLRGSNNVALGYDEGSIIIKVSKSNMDSKETYLEVVQENRQAASEEMLSVKM